MVILEVWFCNDVVGVVFFVGIRKVFVCVIFGIRDEENFFKVIEFNLVFFVVGFVFVFCKVCSVCCYVYWCVLQNLIEQVCYIGCVVCIDFYF